MKLFAILVTLVVVPRLALGDPPPVPPANEPHLVLAPGQTLKLHDGSTFVTPVDPKDPTAGGIYATPAMARYDLQVRNWYKTKSEVAVEVAEDRGMKGIVLGVAGGFTIGVSVGVFIYKFVKR